MKISLIAAMGENRVIGANGKIPWRIPADFRRFRELTEGHAVIMGRKTFESIGRPLPNRTNIVISANPDYKAEGCTVVPSLERALEGLSPDAEAFVIGGAQIYAMALPRAQNIYLTLVHASPEGDTYFPEFDADAWSLISSEDHPKDETSEYAYTFSKYEKERDKKEVGSKMVDPRFAKGKRYKKILNDIRSTGVCPFCPEHFKWHTKPVLKRSGGWLITENFNPYKNAARHLLIVKKEHKERLEELSAKDWHDIAALSRWAVKEFRIPGGAFAMRFGDSAYTGATVRHIHAHLLVPHLKNGKAKAVSFPVG